MAEKLTIKFSATGDKALIASINALNAANVRLIKGEAAHTALQNKLQKELKQTGKATDKVNRSWVKYHRNVGKAGGITTAFGKTMSSVRSKLLVYAFAVGLVTAGMKKLFDKTIIQEKAEKQLETALGKTSSALLNQASALQQVTTFGDEAIIGAQALIAAFTDDEEQIKLATKATLDLAAAKGMDLKGAADLVSKTLGSTTNSLSRYGIQVEGAVGSSRRLESLTRNIAELYGGQASAAADTFGGRLEQLSNISGDVSEAIGKTFAPVIDIIAQDLKTAALHALDFFKELSEFPAETIVRKFEELGLANENLVTLRVIGMQQRLNQDLSLQERNIHGVLNANKSLSSILSGLVDHEYHRSLKDDIVTQDEYKLSTDSFGDALKRLKTERDTLGESLQNNMDVTDESIRADVDKYMGILQLIVLLEGYQKTIEDVTASIALLGEESTVVGKRTFGEMFQTFMTENKETIDGSIEIAKGFNDILKELAAEAREEAQAQIDVMNEIASAEISALRETTKTEMDLHKKSRAFKRLSVKAQADYEKREMAKLAKAEAAINAEKEAKNAAIRAQANKDIVKQFKFGQAIKIAETISNTAAAIMAVTKDASIFAAPWIAAYTALGAAQVAMISKQTAPTMAEGGLIGGNLHSQGGTMINAERGEFIMRRDAVDTVGIETMNRINEGGIGGTINISFSGNVLSRDFIEDEAIPQIRDAIRRGEDIGIG